MPEELESYVYVLVLNNNLMSYDSYKEYVAGIFSLKYEAENIGKIRNGRAFSIEVWRLNTTEKVKVLHYINVKLGEQHKWVCFDSTETGEENDSTTKET